ncbi:MAG: hypothetical protein QGI33_05080, partial [Candidatus Brocadiia bacterium]|nr:hypothetical protein [Candidatus Brocadiia bacterium]
MAENRTRGWRLLLLQCGFVAAGIAVLGACEATTTPQTDGRPQTANGALDGAAGEARQALASSDPHEAVPQGGPRPTSGSTVSNMRLTTS